MSSGLMTRAYPSSLEEWLAGSNLSPLNQDL